MAKSRLIKYIVRLPKALWVAGVASPGSSLLALGFIAIFAIALQSNEYAASQRALAQQRNAAEYRKDLNFSRLATDPFDCRTADPKTFVSFDFGRTWWPDDGRCAAVKKKQEQAGRDGRAELFSYWPTTSRVDTDMNSGWLADEEKTCLSVPDVSRKIAEVVCEPERNLQRHNIPVKFWGGTERGVASNWKCRRESGEFVCRALD